MKTLLTCLLLLSLVSNCSSNKKCHRYTIGEHVRLKRDGRIGQIVHFRLIPGPAGHYDFGVRFKVIKDHKIVGFKILLVQYIEIEPVD